MGVFSILNDAVLSQVELDPHRLIKAIRTCPSVPSYRSAGQPASLPPPTNTDVTAEAQAPDNSPHQHQLPLTSSCSATPGDGNTNQFVPLLEDYCLSDSIPIGQGGFHHEDDGQDGWEGKDSVLVSSNQGFPPSSSCTIHHPYYHFRPLENMFPAPVYPHQLPGQHRHDAAKGHRQQGEVGGDVIWALPPRTDANELNDSDFEGEETAPTLYHQLNAAGGTAWSLLAC